MHNFLVFVQASPLGFGRSSLLFNNFVEGFAVFLSVWVFQGLRVLAGVEAREWSLDFFWHFAGFGCFVIGGLGEIGEGDGFGVLIVLLGVRLFDEFLFEEVRIEGISHEVGGLFLVTGHDMEGI